MQTARHACQTCAKDCEYIHTLFLLLVCSYMRMNYCANGQVSGNINIEKTAWAPSVLGAVWFCRWVVTHSLCGFQLPWPPSCCLHHTEHPFAFIGRLEQIWLSPAYLENVRLNPSSPVLLTRNGPLRIVNTNYRVVSLSTNVKSKFQERR